MSIANLKRATLFFYGLTLLTILTQAVMAVEFSLAIKVLLIAPLLTPMVGLIKGNPYTYAWSNFVMCFYLCHGLVMWYDNVGLIYIVESVAISLMMLFSIYYAKFQGKAMGLSIRKKKK